MRNEETLPGRPESGSGCPVAPAYPFPFDHPLRPPTEWARLREPGCPIPEVTVRASGDTVRVLTRYEDVRTALSDERRFDRDLSIGGAARLTADETGGPFAIPDRSGPLSSGAAHQRWRRLVNRHFTAKRMTALQPRIREIAHSLVDDMESGPHPADLASAFAFPLPVQVIGALLGAPAEHWDRFSYWSQLLFSLDRYSAEEIRTGHDDFTAYMRELVTRLREKPGDDLLSELATTSGTDEGMPEDELVLTGKLLLAAGHETTSAMIGKITAILLEDRTRWERLKDDRSLLPTAIEELLRYDVNRGVGLPRYLNEDVDLDGRTIPARTTVVTVLPAANRDETVFPAADRLDFTRSPNPHLAFGAGPHSCLGQSLARTELRVAFETLFDRLPDLRLAIPAEELQHRQGQITGSLREIPVMW
ncbi:cytochrome P450 [Streptomyces sp. NPDC001833]|uniref:cytochrome P450 n=1 Tax=Streptomyces sp. NPDC001833 TaxID=3154658 RepID=UPI003321A329